ncbi:MAG TPA: phosphotransferase [Candidatus Paceibacterota bacterium]|nr:phosphotransferase [Candidatus Paceibacterota bacterium]
MQELLDSLKTGYGLTNPRILKTIDRGMSALNYEIEDASGTTYFLKTYNPKRPREELEEIQRAETFFYSKDVPAIAPLSNKKGETLSVYGGQYMALFPWIVDKEYDTFPGEKALSSMAAISAHLHLATKDDKSLRVGRVQDRWHKGNFLRDATALMERIEAIPNPSALDSQAKDWLQLKMDISASAGLRFEDLNLLNDTVIHGDYHYHNVFFDAQDNVSHIFDFERVRLGPRTTELAYGALFNCFDLNNPALDEMLDERLDCAGKYIATYRDIYPIEDAEVRAGILWFYYAHQVQVLWPLNVHYFNNDFRADLLIPKRLNRLKFFSQNLDTLLAVALAK